MPRGSAPRRRLALPFLLFVIAAGAAVALLARPRVVSRDETRVLMDTFVTVRVRAAGERAAAAALSAAFAELDRVARVLDWFDSTSVAGHALPMAGGARSDSGRDAVPAVASGARVAESDTTGAADLARVLAVALDVARRSDGAFDPTIRPLTALWAFGRDPHVPPADSVRAALERVDFRAVRLEDGRARADRPGVLLDLGAIAKGYAVDRAIETLRGAPGVR